MRTAALITGAGGLVGSASVRFLQDKFDQIIGIENNCRAKFFGKDGSIEKNLLLLHNIKNFHNYDVDIRDYDALATVFSQNKVDLVIHTAAQPSHDWSKNVIVDFNVNAVGTLNVLEATRQHSDAVFIFTSTNKVYGNTPNFLPLKDLETRCELPADHAYYNGVDESMSIDTSLHTFFGVSKAAADLLTQEYARYAGLRTGVFRCGCITGKDHQGVPLHGFLSYLTKCAIHREPYTVIGYHGKQVRDNIHAEDLAAAFYEFYKNPRPGEVYNIGGGRDNSCSVIEAIALAEKLAKVKMDYTITNEARTGDHRWWISSNQKFKNHFPAWKCEHNLERIIAEMVEGISNG